MSSVKTAISVEKSLLDKIDATAKNLSLSRSKFFAVAAENYLYQIETQELIEKLNEVLFERGLDKIKKIIATETFIILGSTTKFFKLN